MEIQMNPKSASADVPFYTTDSVSIQCRNIRTAISSLSIPTTMTINNKCRLQYRKSGEVYYITAGSDSDWSTQYSNLESNVWYLAYYTGYSSSTYFLIKLFKSDYTGELPHDFTYGAGGCIMATYDPDAYTKTFDSSGLEAFYNDAVTNGYDGAGPKTLVVRALIQNGTYYTFQTSYNISYTGSAGTRGEAFTDPIDLDIAYQVRNVLSGNYYSTTITSTLNELLPDGTTQAHTLSGTYRHNTTGSDTISSPTWSPTWDEYDGKYEADGGGYTLTQGNYYSTLTYENLTRPILNYNGTTGYVKPWFITPVYTLSSSTTTVTNGSNITQSITVTNNNLADVTVTATGRCRCYYREVGTTAYTELTSTMQTYYSVPNPTLGGVDLVWGYNSGLVVNNSSDSSSTGVTTEDLTDLLEGTTGETVSGGVSSTDGSVTSFPAGGDEVLVVTGAESITTVDPSDGGESGITPTSVIGVITPGTNYYTFTVTLGTITAGSSATYALKPGNDSGDNGLDIQVTIDDLEIKFSNDNYTDNSYASNYVVSWSVSQSSDMVSNEWGETTVSPTAVN